MLNITSRKILHDDVNVILIFKNSKKSDDIWMLAHFQDFKFSSLQMLKQVILRLFYLWSWQVYHSKQRGWPIWKTLDSEVSFKAGPEDFTPITITKFRKSVSAEKPTFISTTSNWNSKTWNLLISLKFSFLFRLCHIYFQP